MEGDTNTALLVPAQETLATAAYLCRDWKRSQGHCKYGEKCKFLHPQLDLSLDMAVARKNRTKNANGKPKRVKKKNKQRNKIFCNWLVQEFSLDFLRNSGGVLDVAGGQGEVSFILKNVFKIPATIIDPRDRIDYSKFVCKLNAGNYHNTRNEGSVNDTQVRYPDHIKLFFTPVLWECVNNEEQTCDPNNYEKEYSAFLQHKATPEYDQKKYFEQIENKAKSCWNPKTLLSSAPSATQSNEGNESANLDLEYVSKLLQNFGCIIGMHPDQATEAIVDYALLQGKHLLLYLVVFVLNSLQNVHMMEKP